MRNRLSQEGKKKLIRQQKIETKERKRKEMTHEEQK